MSKKIKSEKVYRILVIPGEEPKPDPSEGILQSLHEYDHNGNLLLEINYSSDGSVLEKNEYSYDESGKGIGSVIYSEDDDPLESHFVHRDEQGNILKEEITYLDGSVDTIQYHYQDKELMKKIQITDEDEVEVREIFDYDDGKMILYEKYNEEDQLVYSLKNTFEEGILRGTEVWSSEDGEHYKQVITYNDKGRREKEQRYDHNGKLMERNIFEEDENGRIARIIEESRSSKNTTEMTYNEQGRLLTQEETDLSGQLISKVTRDYDEGGRPATARMLYRDRMTGTTLDNFLFYEYEFYD